MNTFKALSHALMATLLLILSGCASTDMEPLEGIKTRVDLDRFMGAWYVIASIPIDIWLASEAGAHNGVESYELRDDGKIATTYTFRKDSFTGPKKTFTPVAWVDNTETNAEWRMQFLWPFHSAYLIVYLDDEYQNTIIGVPNRAYVWIMSRSPDVSETEYQRLIDKAVELGHDPALIQRIPHQWPDTADD